MSVLDVFKQDAFGVLSLTDAINKVPFIPGRAGLVAGWTEQRVNTTSIMIEEKNGVLTIINPTPRGAPGTTIAKQKRTGRQLTIPHYEVNDAVYADEVQGVREFGQENQLQTVQGKLTERLMEHVQQGHDPTLEYQRIGALKGIILNGDGSTLYNLFTEFGVSAPSDIDFDLDNANPASGVVRKKCAQAIRVVANSLRGVAYGGVYALCGDAFWDDLIAHKEVRDTYLGQQEAAQLRGPTAYERLSYGGIMFENYRGANEAGTAFIATDDCRVFPTGVAGLYKTVYAPADYNETVNTLGLPRYSRQYEMANGKGIHLDSQANVLNYCTRPGVLIRGTRT